MNEVQSDMRHFLLAGIGKRAVSPQSGHEPPGFKSHTKRKTTIPHTERRWAAKGEMDWDVVGG